MNGCNTNGAGSAATTAHNGKINWLRVTPSNPCRICERPDWCCYDEAGDWAVCMRVEAGAHRVKRGQDGATYFFHRMTPFPDAVPDAKVVPASGEKIADPDTLDLVYSAIIKESSLSPGHRAALERRGFPADDAFTIGYRTLGKDRRQVVGRLIRTGLEQHFPRVPGLILKAGKWSMASMGGLLFPVRDLAGRIVALRVRLDDADASGGKYRCLSSKKAGGPGPGVPIHLPMIQADRRVVRITEGAVKADIATLKSVVYTIGLASCGTYSRAAAVLAKLKPERVLLSLDADWRTNPVVGRALRGLAETLIAKKFMVELEVWPIEHGKGIDDLLVAGHQPEIITGHDAVNAAIAEHVPDQADTSVRPPRPGADLPAVIVDVDEHRVVAEVSRALAADDQLFQRDGVVVRVVETGEPEPEGEVNRSGLRIHHPEGTFGLRPASAAFVRLRTTAAVRLTKMIETENGLVERDIHPPAWLAPAVIEAPGPIRPIRGVLLGPVVDDTGRLICRPGYDASTRLYLTRSVAGLELLDRPTRDDAREAALLLCELVGQFPWQTPADRSRWLAMLLTACGRYLIDRVPATLITATAAGSGKGLLANTTAAIAHGLPEPITMSWPEGSGMQGRGDEIRKRLASLLHEGASLVLVDNLPRGQAFGCPELDAFLTSGSYYDRELGRNDGARVGGPNRCQLLATGNAITPLGDTADRVLMVRLTPDHPNPRARPASDFDHPDLIDHILRDRVRYLRAALTIWKGWIVGGCVRPAGPSWGSFSGWVDAVAAMLRWLALDELPDPIADRVELAGELDIEAAALRALLGLWSELLGPTPLAAGEVVRRLDGDTPTAAQQAVREALSTLGAGWKWPPTSARVGLTLKAFLRRVVETDAGPMRLESEEDTRNKVHRYLAVRVPTTTLRGVAGGCGGLPVPPRERGEHFEDSKCGLESAGDRELPPQPPATPRNPGAEEREVIEL